MLSLTGKTNTDFLDALIFELKSTSFSKEVYKDSMVSKGIPLKHSTGDPDD